MARSEQVRYQLFLPKAVAERFEKLAAAPGASKSKLLAAAVDAWLNRRGTDELEERFARRLDRLSNQLARIERDGHVHLESLALFIRYMLTVNAPLPEGDEAARAIGRDRFAAFVQRVGQQLATGRLTLIPEEPR
jgi:DNA-binding transcriptional MocR family regulator